MSREHIETVIYSSLNWSLCIHPSYPAYPIQGHGSWSLSQCHRPGGGVHPGQIARCRVNTEKQTTLRTHIHTYGWNSVGESRCAWKEPAKSTPYRKTQGKWWNQTQDLLVVRQQCCPTDNGAAWKVKVSSKWLDFTLWKFYRHYKPVLICPVVKLVN